MRNPFTNKNQLRHLSQAERLEEQPPPHLVSLSIFLLVALFICIIAWASHTPIFIRAHAQGKLSPSEQIYPVQHEYGGRIKSIHVIEGQKVAKGDLLLEMFDNDTLGERKQLTTRKTALKIQSARLQAQISGTAPEFDQWQDSHPTLVGEQQNAFNAAISAYSEDLDVLKSRLDEQKGQTDQLQSRRTGLKEQIKLAQDMLEIRQTSYGGGYGTKTALIDAQQNLSQLTSQENETKDRLQQSMSASEALENEITQYQAKNTQQLREELGRLGAELAELDEAIARLSTRLEQVTITAPTDGFVHGLDLAAIGSVIRPGDVLFNIIPTQSTMIAEAKVKTSDIGYMQVGDIADVIIDGFDVSRYGAVSGKVDRLSAYSFANEDGSRYYVARIALDDTAIRGLGQEHPLQPGMTVTAGIVTDQQSLLQYMLHPVRSAVVQAFSER